VQPGETMRQPAMGFQVASVHSIEEAPAMFAPLFSARLVTPLCPSESAWGLFR